MKKIPLTQGKFAIVDDTDYKRLSEWKWCATKMKRNFYAIRCCHIDKNGKQYTISMHREILRLKSGDKRQADHINHNTLDNRRENLRVVSSSQNAMNRHSRLGSSSKYLGVSWNKRDKRWCAAIRTSGLLIHLGNFNREIDAAYAYNAACLKYHGRYGNPNKLAQQIIRGNKVWKKR